MLATRWTFAVRLSQMAVFHCSRLQPLSAAKSSFLWGRHSETLRPVLARPHSCRVQKMLVAACVYVSRGVAGNSHGRGSGSSVREEEVVEKEQVHSAELPVGERAPLVVVLFYKFAHLPDFEEKLAPLKELCETHFVSGGIMLAAEGINGSICGTREAVEIVMSAIQSDKRLTNLLQTEAPAGVNGDVHSAESPLGAGENSSGRWDRMRVKLKKELVSMGVPGLDPADKAGEYVKPKDWNKLISDPDTVVVDARNSYEYRVGRFKRAVDLQLDSFRDFPAWVEKNLASGAQSDFSRGLDGDENTRSQDEENHLTSFENQSNLTSPRRIAMYCTSGIRCEKATSYLLNQGFDEVYQLEGGIVKYLEEIPASESLWMGECFVFDKRVAVGHGLKQGSYSLCHSCKKPVNSVDKESPLWEEGVTCPYCYHQRSEAQRRRARNRHEQFLNWGTIGGPYRGRKKRVAKSSHLREDKFPERPYYFTLKSTQGR